MALIPWQHYEYINSGYIWFFSYKLYYQPFSCSKCSYNEYRQKYISQILLLFRRGQFYIEHATMYERSHNPEGFNCSEHKSCGRRLSTCSFPPFSDVNLSLYGSALTWYWNMYGRFYRQMSSEFTRMTDISFQFGME